MLRISWGGSFVPRQRIFASMRSAAVGEVDVAGGMAPADSKTPHRPHKDTLAGT
jgi:hypothetical protein